MRKPVNCRHNNLDYIIWMAIGMPFVFVGLVLLLLITGGFRGAH